MQRTPDPFADIHDLSQWTLSKSKESGATHGGPLAGMYTDVNHQDRIIFVKQDKPAKMFAEFLASRLMRALEEVDPEFDGVHHVAQVEFTRPSNGELYLASLGFNHYTELHKDAYAAFYQLPAYEPLRVAKGITAERGKVPDRKARPNAFESDDVIKTMMEVGRYKKLPKLLVLSLFVGNYDVHDDNIGTSPIPSERLKRGDEQTKISYKNHENKDKEVYQQVDTCLIDLGASFGDPARRLGIKKRRFGPDLHLNKFLLPSTEGPPNYFKSISQLIIGHPQFNRELTIVHNAPSEMIKRVLFESLDEISKQCKDSPQDLASFADLIGFDYPSDHKDQPDLMLQDIKTYLDTTLQARQQDCDRLAKKKLVVDEHTNMLRLVDDESKRITRALTKTPPVEVVPPVTTPVKPTIPVEVAPPKNFFQRHQDKMLKSIAAVSFGVGLIGLMLGVIAAPITFGYSIAACTAAGAAVGAVIGAGVGATWGKMEETFFASPQTPSQVKPSNQENNTPDSTYRAIQQTRQKTTTKLVDEAKKILSIQLPERRPDPRNRVSKSSSTLFSNQRNPSTTTAEHTPENKPPRRSR